MQVVPEGGGGLTWNAFLDATAAGHPGLCLSREFPDRLRALLGPREVALVWLSNAGRSGSARPGDLAGLKSRIETAVTAERVTAVYIDSVEVLIRVNSVEAVVEFLREVDRFAQQHGIRVWVPVNPLLAAEADCARLATEFSAPAAGR